MINHVDVAIKESDTYYKETFRCDRLTLIRMEKYAWIRRAVAANATLYFIDADGDLETAWLFSKRVRNS
jgi:hypothetical protein